MCKSCTRNDTMTQDSRSKAVEKVTNDERSVHDKDASAAKCQSETMQKTKKENL